MHLAAYQAGLTSEGGKCTADEPKGIILPSHERLESD